MAKYITFRDRPPTDDPHKHHQSFRKVCEPSSILILMRDKVE